MLWWVLEAKYRDTELKILEMGDSSPCTAEDIVGVYTSDTPYAFFVWKTGVEGLY
jgi:hypothetical protein